MLLSGGGDRPTSPAPLTGCLPGPGRPRRSAGPLPGILPAAGADGRERRAGLRLSPARLPLRGCWRGNGQVSASFPHFCPARRRGCLRSVVTCHCRSCSFIKLCLLLAPAAPALPFAGGRVLGVNWFCAEGGRGELSRSAERSSAPIGRGGWCEPCAPAAARGCRPPREFAARARRRRGRPAERSFFLPRREPAGPVQQAPSCGARAGGGGAPRPPAGGSRRHRADLCPFR